MANLEIGPLLNSIGRYLVDNGKIGRFGTLVHARADKNYAEISIFKDNGNRIEWASMDLDLAYLILDLWEAEEPDKRWLEICYMLKDGKFTTDFTYGDYLNDEYDPFVRREEFIQKYFGGREVFYPPEPDFPDHEE